MSSADTYSSAQSSVPSAPSTSTSNSTPQTTNAETAQTPASVAQSNVAGDGLKCEWQSCGDRLPNAEALYDHVCERHVGRKSTNNLNLTCGWGQCRTTTVKRDHITSHIRVHVPLKPHKCDFCQKAFKRPQDLKKHVKTHAEDSSFQANSDAGRSQHAGTGVFSGGAKHVADLQHLAATAAGYYPDHHNIGVNPSYPPYPNGTAANPSAYHGPAGYHQANYMTALYPISAQSAMTSEYEVRKKATFDALNEFFGDIKTRSIDPGVYNAVGNRLMSLQNLTSYSAPQDFSGHTAVASATHAPFANHYSLPMSNIRTKNDLQHIDKFLEELQSTVYEHETQAAQAGVQQAGIHYQHAGLNLRTSNSPPHIGSHNYSSHHTLPPIASTASDTTPALTPASSVMSYNSPPSVHSATISPISRGSNASMYPTLPSVSSVSDAISGAIPSALASSFDDSRRRFSSGHLHKARSTRESSESTELPAIDRLGVRSPSLPKVDPALDGKDEKTPERQSPGSPKEKDSKDKPEDPDWIVKIRTLEAIRVLIKQRLENNIFEDDEDAETIKPESSSPKEQPQETEEEKEARSLYPVLRAVQEAEA